MQDGENTAPSGNHIAARAVDLVKVYGAGDTAVRALDGISVGFPAAEFSAIMGPSGSGKSTLMHCMAGLDSITSGQVFVGDTDLSRLDDRHLTELRRDHVGFVFQAFNLLPQLSAEENILLPLSLAGRKPDMEFVEGVIARVGLTDRRKHRPGQLSGGQQQRVAVARALAGKPAILLADEPTGNLDSRNGEAVMNLLRELHREGATICMVTHDPRYADYADRKVQLFDGRVMDESKMIDLSQRRAATA